MRLPRPIPPCPISPHPAPGVSSPPPRARHLDKKETQKHLKINRENKPYQTTQHNTTEHHHHTTPSQTSLKPHNEYFHASTGRHTHRNSRIPHIFRVTVPSLTQHSWERGRNTKARRSIVSSVPLATLDDVIRVKRASCVQEETIAGLPVCARVFAATER
ncbi:hypothetical protein E2C01_002635 [Portunus trituberculatus]|uniref:Uncharacterized protein n=1 Tax=Portunus trituberculatus TaxID=210409 RepID=A0A5B7CKV4_PORTR|nr:hypothetical protein [Portunus trituberculatus]